MDGLPRGGTAFRFDQAPFNFGLNEKFSHRDPVGDTRQMQEDSRSSGGVTPDNIGLTVPEKIELGNERYTLGKYG